MEMDMVESLKSTAFKESKVCAGKKQLNIQLAILLCAKSGVCSIPAKFL